MYSERRQFSFRTGFITAMILVLVSATGILGAETVNGITLEHITVQSDRNKTREPAVLRFLDMKEGDTFETVKQFQMEVEEQRQRLYNQRVFESVEADIIALGDGNYRVVFTIVDSFTLIPFPYVAYDSNYGLSLGLDITYDNAFGTMTDWYLGTYLTLGDDYNGNYGVQDYAITPVLESLKIGRQEFSIVLSQEYATNEIGEASAPSEYWTENSTFVAVGTSWEFHKNWYVGFRPMFRAQYGYKWYVVDPATSEEDRYTITWNQYVGPSRVDYMPHNFRKGYSARLVNNLSALGAAAPNSSDTEFRFTTDLTAEASVYYILGRRFNFYHRIEGYYLYNNENKYLGYNLRGVRDGTMTGNSGVFLQNSFGLDIVHWTGVFDFQIHPFFDIGYSAGGTADYTDELRYGFGADIYIFIDKVSNLTLRATIGFDPTRDFQSEILLETEYSY